ncbi:MAG: glycosyltransferase family 39 protein [Elusimicrobiales bacterium]|nr:glycosyltransferase family 39 protein [Elusimicrobiales bacterium]
MNNDFTPGWLDSRRAAFVLFALCAVLYFAFTGMRALWDPGEGRYALISREMAETGNWLVPHLNGARYFEKPPLAYWLNAFAMKIGGFNEIAARFFTALSGFAAVLFAFAFTSRLYGSRTAALAAGILFSAVGFFAWSQIPELDMLFTCLLLSGAGLIYLAFERLTSHPKLAAHAGYVLLGLACLVKGPAAFALALLIFAPYLVIGGGWRRIGGLYPFTGVPLALAVAAPWFIAISLREKEFFHFFFIHEHLERYTSTVHGRRGEFWYFLPVLAGMLYPWLPAVPAALGSAWKEIRSGGPERRHALFLGLWAVVIVAFFSVSGSKRPPYILPVLPPLAMLTARWFDKKWAEGATPVSFAVAYAALNAVVAAALVVVPGYTQYLGPGFSIQWWYPVSALAAASALAVYFARRGSLPLVFASALCGAVVFNAAVYLAAAEFDGALSRKEMARLIMREFKPGDKIVAWNADYERNFQSLGYYSGQRVRVAGDPGELEFGAGLEPQKREYFPDEKTVSGWLASDTRVFLVMKARDLARLDQITNVRLYPDKPPPGKLVALSNKPWQREIK